MAEKPQLELKSQLHAHKLWKPRTCCCPWRPGCWDGPTPTLAGRGSVTTYCPSLAPHQGPSTPAC